MSEPIKYNKDDAFKKSLVYFEGDELAANVFLSKYALKDKDRNLLEETPDQMHDRLAKEFYRIEQKYPNPLSYEEIRESFDHFKKIIPQGSPMEGVGNEHVITSISNCYVIPSPQDSYGGIFKADQQEAQLMKRRGGVGMDISNIRPKGIATNNSAKTTDGIAVFMDRFSNTCREVAQNGRRGALMITISIMHPEVETFINIKRDKTRVTGANISIKLTDDFMKAVKNDTTYTQKWPVDSENPVISKQVKAKEIWDKIVDSAWESAEPGILFWDTAVENTPSDCYSDEGFRSVSTNPCLIGDTKIKTIDGYKTINDIFNTIDDVKEDIKIINYDTLNNSIDEDTITQCLLTKKDADVIEILFDDNSVIKLTPNHKVYTTNRGYVEAKNLTEDDEIVSIESI